LKKTSAQAQTKPEQVQKLNNRATFFDLTNKESGTLKADNSDLED
jgi:hypothetical protein